MESPTARVTAQSLLKLFQKLYQFDRNQPLLVRLRDWSIALVLSVWLVVFAAAPIILFLVFFGINVTVDWLIAFAGLSVSIFLILGLDAIGQWFAQALRGGKPNTLLLLSSITVIIFILGGLFLFLYGFNDTLPLLARLSVAVLLAITVVAWEVYRFISERQTKFVFRALSLIASLYLAISWLIGLANFMMPETASRDSVIYRSNFGSYFTTQHLFAIIILTLAKLGSLPMWDKRKLVQIGVLGAIFLVALVFLVQFAL